MNLELISLTLHPNSFKTVHVKWFCNSVFQGWRLYYLNILLLIVFSCIVVSEKRIRWSCTLSVLADLCLKTQGIQRAFAAPWSRSAEGFNEIGNKEVRSTYRWQTSPCVFLSRSYTVLNPSFLCLCNFGFGWQPPAWLGVDRTQLILLDIQGAVAIGRFIQQLKRFFFFNAYTHFHSLFDLLFNYQLAFVTMIPASFGMILLFLPLPTFPKGWFVENTSFCPASYKERATLRVQILNCLQFQS